jgi:hypothetical protein
MTAVLLTALALFVTAPETKLEAAEERAILEAVAMHPKTVQLFGPHRVTLTDATYLWPGQPIFYRPGIERADNARAYSGELLHVPEALFTSLQARNKHSISLRKIPRPPKPGRNERFDKDTSHWERVALSRPGLGPDGLTALVAVMRSDNGGGEGYGVYLEKRDGVWTVVGECCGYEI